MNFSIQLLYSSPSECLFLFFFYSFCIFVDSLNVYVCVCLLLICFLLAHWTFYIRLFSVLHQVIHISVSLQYVTGLTLLLWLNYVSFSLYVFLCFGVWFGLVGFCWNLDIWRNSHLASYSTDFIQGRPSLSAWIKIWGTSTLLGIHLWLSWVCHFSIRQVCQFFVFRFFFFKVLFFCSLWCLFVVLHVHRCSNKPLSSLFSVVPKHPKYVGVLHQHSKLDKTETSPWDSSLKSWDTGCIFHFSLSFPRENLQVCVFFWLPQAVLVWGRGCRGLNTTTFFFFLTCFSAVVLGFVLAWSTVTS